MHNKYIQIIWNVVKIIALLALSRVAILQNHAYRMPIERPCFEQSGIYIIAILAVIIFGIYLLGKSKITKNIQLFMVLSALAIQYIQIIRTLSFELMLEWEETNMIIATVIVIILSVLIAYALFGPKPILMPIKKIHARGIFLWLATSSISHTLPFIKNFNNDIIYSIVSIIITLGIMFLIFMFIKRYVSTHRLTLFYEIAFVIIALNTYAWGIWICKTI